MTLDSTLKQKIDALVAEIATMTDLVQKVSVLEYMEREAGYLLWQLSDEIHIDADSQNV